MLGKKKEGLGAIAHELIGQRRSFFVQVLLYGVPGERPQFDDDFRVVVLRCTCHPFLLGR